MEKRMYKAGVFTTAQMTQENLQAEGRSSAQIIKQARKKKHIARQQIKTRRAQRRPPQQIAGPSWSRSAQGLNTCKRVVPQNQECRLKICYGNLMGSLAKFPPESHTRSISPKMASKQSLTQGHPNGSRAKAKERIVPGKEVGETEHPQPPSAEKPRKLNERENQSLDRRLKPTAKEKRRYPALSEYHVIYPGRAVFHCTREAMKQRLRSIYLANHRQIKQRASRVQREANKAQRGNPSADPRNPASHEFLGGTQPAIAAQGLPGLTYKINKLVLVSEKARPPLETRPGTPARNWEVTPPEHPPSREKPGPQAKASQSLSAFLERKVYKEGHVEDQGGDPDPFLQGNTLPMPHACSTKTPWPRPMTAKDCYEKPQQRMLGEEDQTGASAGQEAGSGSTPAKTTIAHSRSAIIIPTVSRLLSNESVSAEGANSNIAPSVAEARQPVPHYVAFGQAAVRDPKRAGILAAHPDLAGRRDKPTPS